MVSRNGINANSPVVIVVPVTGLEHKGRIYPSQVVLKAGEGGLAKDFVALDEQVRVIAQKEAQKAARSFVPSKTGCSWDALKIALDLP